MRRALLATVGAAVAAGVVAVALAVPHAASTAPAVAVTGYADDGTTIAQLRASAGAVTTVGVDGVNLTADGDGLTDVSPASVAMRRAAHARHERAELLVGNFDGGLGDFSPDLATAMLGSEEHRAHIVWLLRREVVDHGWDGITVDLESLRSSDAAGLTAFVDALKHALGSHAVAVALMATTSSYSRLGYDIPALARSADRLVLMGYDQHGPWSESGPVGGMPWVEKTLDALLVDAPASRVELGIAGYGYTWPGDAISPRHARWLVAHDGATATWSTLQQEWHATLSDGTVVWWSDARSYRARLALARGAGLHGVAVWSLALADPLTTPAR